MAKRKTPKPPTVVIPSAKMTIWETLIKSINDKETEVIPILSNSFINNLVFDINGDYRPGASEDELEEKEYILANEYVAEAWAQSIQYPLQENLYKLSRVAQYNQVTSDSPNQAKRKYLDFLKRLLLALASGDDKAKHLVPELEQQLDELSFFGLANELGYPRYDKPKTENPLYMLAELPLKYYLTTSHHDFLEQALKHSGKEPQSMICYWHLDRADIPHEEKFKVPTVKAPLVYHLYGIEDRSSSIVISEDDYMDFLIKVSEDKDIIPVQLRGAMAESSLLLLGYRLRDWDFRVLLRGVIKPSTLRGSNLAIQFDQPARLWEDPDESDQDTSTLLQQKAQEKARSYLEDYFKELNDLKVQWFDTTAFVKELSAKWKESQR